MSSERTAWHPPFTTAMRERGPRWVKVSGEVQLTQEPLRADDMFELRVDVPRDPADCGSVLRGLWPLVRAVCLLEFKSISRPFRRGDLARLLAYGLVWFYTHQAKAALTLPRGRRRRARPNDLTLALVVPTLTRTLRREVEQMGLTLHPSESGYHRATGAFCTVVVIELSRVAAVEHDELMGWFAGKPVRPSMDLARWIGQNTSTMNAPDKASPDLAGFADWFAHLRDALPPEMRFAGARPEELLAHLKPEERVAGLKPEERVAGLSEVDQILALPDAALRGLSPEYLATLPEAAQARIRERLGR